MIELPEGTEIERTQAPDYYSSDARAFAQDVILHEMRERGRWSGEISFRNWRTNAPIPVLDTHFLVRDAATQKLIGHATITRDISAQKAQRDELERANQRLSETARELKESQRFLQGVLDHSPNAIVIKSLDGRYLVANDSFRALRHLGTAEVRGKTDAELFPGPLGQRLHANDEKALATKRSVITEEVLENEGERCVYVVAKFPLLDEANNIQALCAIWTDISELKRKEQALAYVAADLRRAQSVAHVGSWRRLDVRSGDLVWSDELYRIFGVDPSSPAPSLFRNPSNTLLTPESRLAGRAAYEKALADGTPYELELEFNRPDGTTGWVSARGEPIRDDSGRIIGLDGTAADITKVKELQRLRDEWTSVIAHDLRQPISTIIMGSDFLPELHPKGISSQEREIVDRIHAAGDTLKRMVDDLLDMSLLQADRLKLERQPTYRLTRERDVEKGGAPERDRTRSRVG